MLKKRKIKKVAYLPNKSPIIKRLNKTVVSLKKDNQLKDGKITHLHVLIEQWKTLFELSTACRDKLIRFLQSELKKSGEKITHLEDVCRRYHEDLIIIQRENDKLTSEVSELKDEIEEKNRLLQFYDENLDSDEDDFAMKILMIYFMVTITTLKSISNKKAPKGLFYLHLKSYILFFASPEYILKPALLLPGKSLVISDLFSSLF